jgi:hypothetical protein
VKKSAAYHIGLLVSRPSGEQRLYIWHDKCGPSKTLCECKTQYMAAKICKALNAAGRE